MVFIMNSRHHFLDAARGVLMTLGVFLHAANIYRPNSKWLVEDYSTHPFFSWVVNLIHSFRMPAFYWVAGYFTALIFARQNKISDLLYRLRRIGIPLIFILFFGNGIQDVILGRVALWGSVVPPLYHLWFLFDLLLYTIFVFWFFGSALHVAMLNFIEFGKVAYRFRCLVFIIFSWMLLVLVRVTPFAYIEVGGFTSLFRLALLFPWFLLGALMFHDDDSRQLFLITPWWILFGTLPLIVFFNSLDLGGSLILNEINLILRNGLIFLSIGAILNFFYLFANFQNKFLEFLNEASYTIYLLSHMIVVVLGYAFLFSPMAPIIKYISIVVLTISFTMLFHYFFVRKYTVFALLFNGR